MHTKTIDIKENIVNDYLAGMKVCAIAQKYSISKSTVNYCLSKLNVKRDRFKRKKQRTEKVCKFCQKTLPISYFTIDSRGVPDSDCKKCDVEKDRIRRNSNPVAARVKADASKRYRAKNRKLINERTKIRRLNNIDFRIKGNLRTRINSALHGIDKSTNTMRLIGCSIEEFKFYLESLFLPGMTWENYGQYGWHVDHVLPCASFDLSKEEEQRKCFHYKNLQPLWWRDNINKWNHKDRLNYSSPKVNENL